MSLDYDTCVQDFEHPTQVRLDLIWKINLRGLSLNSQTQTMFILHNHYRYMMRVL
jgi:hypothetical protein